MGSKRERKRGKQTERKEGGTKTGTVIEKEIKGKDYQGREREKRKREREKRKREREKG